MARKDTPDLSASEDTSETSMTRGGNGAALLDRYTINDIDGHKSAMATFNSADLATITSFEDALSHAMNSGSLIDSRDIGDGYVMETDKDKFIGVPLIITDWYFGTRQDFGDLPWLIIKLITNDNKRYIITDGGTGLCREILVQHALSGNEKKTTFMCWRGFTRSDYLVDPETGKAAGPNFEGKGLKAHTYFMAQGGPEENAV